MNRRSAAAALRTAAAAALILVTVVSALLTANGFAFDAARWHTAERFAQAGVPPRRIAAGLEWTGWHAPHGMIYARDRAGQPGGWELAFYRRPACLVLSPSRLPHGAQPGGTGWTPAGAYPYRTFLIGGQSRLYGYWTHAAGCRA